MESLAGKIALVTGGSRGIGLAIAQAFSERGAVVVLVARRRTALEAARKKIGGRTEAAVADVTKPAEVRRLFQTVKMRHRRLDILINSAGVFTYQPFARTTLAHWRTNLESNLTSLFLVTRAALPLLLKSGSAQIVNILSISSVRAFPNCSAYTAAKFGALGFTRVIREELQGIRVTAVLPGSTQTRLAREFGFRVPASRLLQPRDVAEAVVAALLQPARATVEEIIVMPSKGAL